MRVSKIVALSSLAVAAAGFALADMPPHQKPGLWESSVTAHGRAITTQSCISEESEAKLSAFSSQSRQKNCSSSSFTHNMDGSWDGTTTCKFGTSPERTTHAHVTGDANSKINIVITVNGSTTPEVTTTMTWLGACKPGMKGGDVIMSNGMKMNVLDGTMSGMPAH